MSELEGYPCGAGLLAKGGGRDSDQGGLPVHDGFGVVVQPGKSGVDGTQGGQFGDTGEGRAAREHWHELLQGSRAVLGGTEREAGLVLVGSFLVGTVFDGMEKEALGWGGGAGGGTGAGGKDGWDMVQEEMAAAHVDHGANEIADHVVKEAVAADSIDEELAGFGGELVPGGRKDGAQC